jgi:hypothetical protein
MGLRVAVACVVLGACTFKGSGKSTTPGFKTYKKPHALALSSSRSFHSRSR